jgi:hypothetical protein
MLNGPDREAFGALGEHVREELADLAEGNPRAQSYFETAERPRNN